MKDWDAWVESGEMPVSQTQNAWSNAWKMDSRWFRPPASQIARSQCIASRNGRELAEHLGYFDIEGSWPVNETTMFVPKHNHTSPETDIHVDLFGRLACSSGSRAAQ